MNKIHFNVIIFLFIFLSCSQKPIKVFTINNSVIKFYSDYTFSQDEKLLERTITFIGTWEGSLNENDTVTTISTFNGLNVLTATPEHRYVILNNHLVEIEK